MSALVVNLYGGPGTGKSTTAAMVFAHLKSEGVNCELVQEYAKDITWKLQFGNNAPENSPHIRCQEHITVEQHFRQFVLKEQVDVIITDSPILMGLVYIPENYQITSLPTMIIELFNQYNNLNIMLGRVKAYNPKGRNQTFEEACQKDAEILQVLNDTNQKYISVDANIHAGEYIAKYVLGELHRLIDIHRPNK